MKEKTTPSPSKPSRPLVKYVGHPYIIIPELCRDGNRIASLNDLLNKKQEIEHFSIFSGFSTNIGDAVIYHPDGRGKLVLDATPSNECRWRDSQLINGGLMLPDNAFDSIPGLDFIRTNQHPERPFYDKRKGILIESYHTKEEAIDSVILNFLARDREILTKYATRKFGRPPISISPRMTVKLNLNGHENYITMHPLHFSISGDSDLIHDSHIVLQKRCTYFGVPKDIRP